MLKKLNRGLFPWLRRTKRRPPPDPLPEADQATPSSEEPPSTVLDISAYPHILDLVIAYSSHAALLQLRATCSALRSTVDAILCRHMVLWDTEARSRIGRHPVFQTPVSPVPGPNSPSAKRASGYWRSAARAPASSRPDDPVHANAAASQRTMLAQTQVLDWKALDKTPLSDLRPFECLQGVHTIRTWSRFPMTDVYRTFRIPVATHVFFTWPAVYGYPRPTPTLVSPDSDWLAGWQPPQRTVINCGTQQVFDLSLWSRKFHSDPLVIVFTERPPPLLMKDFSGDPIWLNVLQFLLTPVFDPQRHGPPSETTFVNASVLPELETQRWRLFFSEEFTGAREALPPTATLQVVVDTLKATMETDSKITFLSLDEYREAVGDEQFMLDTQEDYILR